MERQVAAIWICLLSEKQSDLSPFQQHCWSSAGVCLLAKWQGGCLEGMQVPAQPYLSVSV